MKRLHYLAVLMVLGSSVSTAQAGYSHSFVIGGHRIHLEARRGCRSLSCVSWYDSGSRDRRDRDDDAAPAQPAPAVQARSTCAPVQQPVQQAQVQPAAAPQVQASQVQIVPPPPPAPVVTAPPATKISTETVAPRTVELAATTTQSVPPPAPKVEARIVVLPSPVVTQPAAPAPAKAKDEKANHEKAKDEKAKDEKATNEETAADTPLGDWQTEGKKGLVRIEQCGKSLCGYVLNRQTSSKGETVLSNMKSQTDNKWAGDIYSRASGNSYYARMTLKTPNTLHVEACAVLRFFCSGKDWTRVVTRPDEMIISRQGTNPPSS